MDLDKLTRICFTICIICIVAGTVLSLVMIWGELHDNATVWKCWLTLATFFLAAALTMSVSKALRWRAKDRE
jgi:hypothetical protein